MSGRDRIRSGRPRGTWTRRPFAAGLVGGLAAATFLYVPPALAKPYEPGRVQRETMVGGRSAAPVTVAAERTGRPFTGAAPRWPAGKVVDVDLTTGAGGGPGRAAAADGLPVRVGVPSAPAAAADRVATAPGRVRVTSFSREATSAAGVDGVLLRVSRADGQVAGADADVTVDYSGFRWAYGGDWAGRLRLRELPECALVTPDAPGCAAREVPSRNDLRAGTVSATVGLTGWTPRTERGRLAGDGSGLVAGAGTLVALTAGAESPAGDFKATSLAPAATWTAGGNSGDFSWTYPLRTPPGLGGPTPNIDLAYSSSGVDGRMVAANNQPSWIGEGFDWSPGYVERRYTTCSEDMGPGANNTKKTGDQCWDTDNATLVLGSRAGELIRHSPTSARWHLRNDDGTYVERRTGGGNGDDDGEWWVVTTPDGVQYWFGGRAGSKSTLTVPVYGNHDDEPCHASSFASSRCDQAWRWQLDHVVDRHGNTMDLFYAKETNKYGRNGSTSDPTGYDRSGHLTKIEYGTRTGGAGSAPMQVLFEVGDRCLSGCATRDATHWPDVPWDQDCTGDTCDSTAPTFWSTKRLASVTTRVWDATTVRYRDVERWTFTHSFPDPVDSQPGGLWLEKISHQGLVGATTDLPDITFVGVALANRVDTLNDQYPAMKRFRIKTVNTETGGKLDVTYSDPQCVKGTRVPDRDNLHANTLRCYPVKWTPGGHDDPIHDYFHKYLVTDVVEADLAGSSTRVRTHYDYLGDPAWHYTDDDGLIDKKYKTWSVWRGYGQVDVVKGDPGEQTLTSTRYFRGMHGDKTPSGTRSVSLPAIGVGNVPAAPDEDAYSGMVRETITHDGPDGAEVQATVNEPWQSAPTASRTVNGFTVHARHTGTAAEHTRTALDGGRAPRTTTKRTTFDGYGMPSRIENRGDNAVPDDQRCELVDYARNTSPGGWMLDRVSRTREFAVDCARVTAGGLTDDDVIEDEKTSYDQLAWNAAPTRGLVSRVETIDAWNGGNPTYRAARRATYDAYGRVGESWDLRGNRTRTSYTPASGGPVTAVTETNQLDWVNHRTMEPAWQLPLTTTDANGRQVGYAYDGLGRLTSVWFPGRDRAAQTANLVFDYLVRADGPLVVTTKRLTPAGSYHVSHQFYDNLVRLLQTQEPDGAGGAGAVVSSTFYDSAGRAFKTHEQYLACKRISPTRCDPVAPSTNLFQPTDVIPAQKVSHYDGAGRETALVHQVDAAPASPGGTEKWRTTTAYGGDRSDVTPPAGGVVTSTLTDAHGNLTELRYYHSGVPAGSSSGYDRTRYTYNRKSLLAGVTDPAGQVWAYTYDLLGRQTKAVDPDKGTIETTYTQYGEVETTKDGRGVTLAYTYDPLGRKESLRDGSVTGPKRAEWFYDTLGNGVSVKGQLVRTIRHVGADQYVKENLGYTVDYQPTSLRYTIPTAETGLAGSYSYVYTYHQDGSEKTTRLPALGNLGLETLTRDYDARGRANTLATSIGASYVTGTDYTSFDELGAIHLRNNGGRLADIVRTYEKDTRRLAQIWTTRQNAPTTVADVRFEYDPAGNVEEITDRTAGDTQCFTTDHLRQLTGAWTPAGGDCDVAPTVAGLGGPAKYWHSYTYDAVGNRRQLVERATPTGTRTTTYTPQAGRHRLAGTSTVDDTGTKTASYGYDASGNTITRPTAAGGVQNLTWDAEGRLASSQDATGTTSYVYDVDGTRLVRRDPAGRTLYLPGQELRYDAATGAKTCVRYYSHAGETVAMRTGAGVTWLVSDHHGTAQVAFDAVNQNVATRRETPFGLPRGSTGVWPTGMDKGFVGGTRDNTGLTHLGAREYDPLIGRFVSVDPIIDVKDAQQMHGYAYAANAPVTTNDPDGLLPGWMQKAAQRIDNARANVANVAKQVSDNVVKGVVDNAGMISAVTGVAAVACMVIPGAQVLAPALAAVSAVTGAIDTAKSCAKGDALDCGLGVAGMIPGARTLTLGVKGLHRARKANAGIKNAEELIDVNKNLRGTPGFKDMDRALRRELRDAREAAPYWREYSSAHLNPWSKSGLAEHRGWNWYERVVLTENSFWEGYKLGWYAPGEDYGDASRQGRRTSTSKGKSSSSGRSSGRSHSNAGAASGGGEAAGTSGASYWRGI
ncbi:transcriptional regulator [Micromonospora sp. WMMD882]|uniref:RHS repeat domain-containing protein n=1 Tax=Micromonospora sp. WMMD882 TaxID=3015151 RepID=UPI00248ABA4C|nr:RHS repeat-associated core domain-containing protein [Micromonospora sp. WMMD882]WBB78833.1 transcriptional regulator [Micromonospora sp. WMMD882]